MAKAYDHLCERVQEISELTQAKGVLAWDRSTYMPSQGAEQRAKVVSRLGTLIHRASTAPEFGELASEVAASPDEHEQAVGKHWLKVYNDSKKLPESLVKEISEACSLSESDWTPYSTFDSMLPHLEKLVGLSKQYAACFSEMQPYDALIDDFDPGLTQTYLDEVFAYLKPELLKLREKARAFPAKEAYRGNEEGILALCRHMTESIGFDYTRGNLSVTQHPFMTSIHPEDVRIATWVKLDDPLSMVTGAIHEAGHGIYEQQTGPDWAIGTGLEKPNSCALHESQSLFYEVMLGKSLPFWEEWIDDFNLFAVNGTRRTLDQILQELRYYDPSNVVRLQAGDLDYGLHIILRYELERDLFNGTIEAKDMKECFDSLCQRYFGRKPTDDRKEGVIQDVHWCAGLFGYFPSYLLGVSYAAQLWRHCPTLDDKPQILDYLKERVHQYGGTLNFVELTDKQGGFDPSCYIDYLRNAYEL